MKTLRRMTADGQLALAVEARVEAGRDLARTPPSFSGASSNWRRNVTSQT